MLRKLLLSGIVFVLLGSCFAVSVKADSSTWSQTYGGPSEDEAKSLVHTVDGGYALAGDTESSGAGGSDFWLVKTDAYGNMEWNQTYGGTENERASSLIETSDGGYAITGYTDSFGAGRSDFWVVKTDEYGNLEWNKTYGGTGTDLPTSVIETSDEGYAIAGQKSGDFWLIKIDEFGALEWSKTYGGTGDESVCSLIQTDDDGYAIAGFTNSFGAGSADFWLVKTDEYGEMEWNKTYGGTDGEWIFACVLTSDGGYALAGTTCSFGVDGLLLVKTNTSGTVEWTQVYEKPACMDGLVIETSDSGYAIVTNQNCSGAGDIDLCLIKTDASGNRKWEKTYGGTKIDWINSFVETCDGKYALAGATFSYGAGEYDFWLVKLDECMTIYDFETYEFDFSYGYGEYVVVVSTNSTVSDFNFGIGQDRISFTVTGPTGTTGAATIIIPEDLLGNYPVYINDMIMVEGADYTKMYNGTHTIIDMTYSHSTHMIVITGTEITPEYTTWFIPTLLLATVLLVVITRKKLSK